MLQRFDSFESLPERRNNIYGIDFSGAADAGARIWVAHAYVYDNSLLIEDTIPAEALPESGRGGPAALAAVRYLVRSHPDAVFGFDFPFSLPEDLIHALFGDVTWEEMVSAFAEHFPTPETFRAAAVEVSHGRELRRAMERTARTPFSPYNLRLHRQTYHGIVDILAPLVGEKAAFALPMQPAVSGHPWMIEICPASTLKRIEIYASYKGRTALHAATRKSILMSMEKKGPLSFERQSDRDIVLADPGGDALDSVAAAFAVFKSLQDPSFDLQHPSPDERYRLEGWVYT